MSWTDVQLISYGMNDGHHCMFFTCQLAHGTAGSLVPHRLMSLQVCGHQIDDHKHTPKGIRWFSNPLVLTSLHSNGMIQTIPCGYYQDFQISPLAMVGNECSIRQALTSRRQDFNSAKDKGISTVEVIWWFDDWWLVSVERGCSGLKRACFSHCYSNSNWDKTFIRFPLWVWRSSRRLLDFSTATQSLWMRI